MLLLNLHDLAVNYATPLLPSLTIGTDRHCQSPRHCVRDKHLQFIHARKQEFLELSDELDQSLRDFSRYIDQQIWNVCIDPE